MKKNKNAFTMIELVFVIVIIGILSAIAIPKLASTTRNAQIAKGKSDIASIRSAILTERQSRLIKGDSDWITRLHGTDGLYFDNNGTTANALLMYGVTPQDKDGPWHGVAGPTGADNKYIYQLKLEGIDNNFTYNPVDGTFKCVAGTGNCDKLTN